MEDVTNDSGDDKPDESPAESADEGFDTGGRIRLENPEGFETGVQVKGDPRIAEGFETGGLRETLKEENKKRD
jgi:hypothetical protein